MEIPKINLTNVFNKQTEVSIEEVSLILESGSILDKIGMLFKKQIWISKEKVKQSLKNESFETVAKVQRKYNEIVQNKTNKMQDIINAIKTESHPKASKAANQFFNESLRKNPLQLVKIAKSAQFIQNENAESIVSVKDDHIRVVTYITEQIKDGIFKLNQDGTITLPDNLKASSEEFFSSEIEKYLKEKSELTPLIMLDAGIISGIELSKKITESKSPDFSQHIETLKEHILEKIQNNTFNWSEDLPPIDQKGVRKEVESYVRETYHKLRNQDRGKINAFLKAEDAIRKEDLEILESALLKQKDQSWEKIQRTESGEIYKRSEDYFITHFTNRIITGEIDLTKIPQSE